MGLDRGVTSGPPFLVVLGALFLGEAVTRRKLAALLPGLGVGLAAGERTRMTSGHARRGCRGAVLGGLALFGFASS